MKLVNIFLTVMLFVTIVSCGGIEPFKTPIINNSDIFQSECKDSGGNPLITYEVNGKSITVKHENIWLPEFSKIGIEDIYGDASYNNSNSSFYTPAEERNINVIERVKIGSGKMCAYDFTVKITNISGGEYNLILWDEFNEELQRWDDVWIK